MTFKMTGWSPFKQDEDPPKIDLMKESDAAKNILASKKVKEDLPTFRKGDVSLPQFDKSGKKLYNLID